MKVQLNHTIVWCRDKARSAAFLAEILGRPAPMRFGPFQVVELDNGVSLDFHDTDGDIAPQHYAFLIAQFRLSGDKPLEF
jgi:catechol 2,3-dioxygenase-like lactoylglutathione lyase family enzyme